VPSLRGVHRLKPISTARLFCGEQHVLKLAQPLAQLVQLLVRVVAAPTVAPPASTFDSSNAPGRTMYRFVKFIG